MRLLCLMFTLNNLLTYLITFLLTKPCDDHMILPIANPSHIPDPSLCQSITVLDTPDKHQVSVHLLIITLCTVELLIEAPGFY